MVSLVFSRGVGRRKMVVSLHMRGGSERMVVSLLLSRGVGRRRVVVSRVFTRGVGQKRTVVSLVLSRGVGRTRMVVSLVLSRGVGRRRTVAPVQDFSRRWSCTADDAKLGDRSGPESGVSADNTAPRCRLVGCAERTSLEKTWEVSSSEERRESFPCTHSSPEIKGGCHRSTRRRSYLGVPGPVPSCKRE